MKFDRRPARGEAIMLPNGNISAPVAVQTVVDGETVYGDGRAEYERGTDEWKAWLPYVAGDPPAGTEAMKGVDDG